MVMPVCDWYMGATFFSGPSSAPCTAAIVSLDGLLLDVLVELHAARIVGNELNIAPATAARLTNSRRLIGSIHPPLRLIIPPVASGSMRRPTLGIVSAIPRCGKADRPRPGPP